MPSGRDSFRRNRVAPSKSMIAPLDGAVSFQRSVIGNQRSVISQAHARQRGDDQRAYIYMPPPVSAVCNGASISKGEFVGETFRQARTSEPPVPRRDAGAQMRNKAADCQLTLREAVSIIVWGNFWMKKTTKVAEKPQERALEEAVSRALRDNLIPLQRTVEDLQHAYSDLVAACSSSRPTNALPAMVRAQSASASLSAALAVLSNFVTIALQPREHVAGASDREAAAEMASAVEVAEPAAPAEAATTAPAHAAEAEIESEWASDEAETIVAPAPVAEVPVAVEEGAPATVEVPAEAAPVFDVASLPSDQQELHRRANRVAKVAMQDIKLLRPKDVRVGRENKDICVRLRGDLDKARKEYDRRFKTILDHPVDYFHDWMVAILADGDAEALGEYPYPSPVLHH
jgi:hypothetical protein